ncbi:MAG: S8 family serine peptidase, partial [Nitrosopumilaceae archaeon]
VPDRLLIKFKKDVSNSQKDKLLKDNGASVLSEIKQIDVKLIKVPEQALEKVQAAFAKNSAVEYVEKDFILEPAVIPNDPYYPNQWHLPAINAPTAWDITQGSSIPIAILDTGVDPNHPDLKNKLTLGYNFYNNNNDWSDVCGHGTKVAGSAAAITNNGLGVSGVAWNNPIIPIKITDSSCYGYYSSMINGIVYAADKGARVANISFQIFNGASLSDAARYMNDHGGWVVAAAGNTGILENYSDNPYIISVGSISPNGLVSSFSSYGPFVDFAAPGSTIYTTTSGGTYGYTSGTSFSSPIVAGVIALVISHNPSMTSQQVYDTLKNSAVDKGTTGRDNYYGWGLVDAYGALLQNNPTPPPPDITPPSTPSLLAPADGIVTNDNTPSFDWSDVTDPSLPVTYTLLADNNSDFLSPEISKQSLSSSDYTTATSLADGTYYWKVRSTDSAGNIGVYSSARTVIIDTTPPTITITNPQNGADVTSSFTVSVDSSDNVAVNRVELYLDGSFYGQKTTVPYDFALDASTMSAGTHEIKAVSIDSSGNSNFATIIVNVVRNSIDTIPPSVSITNPSNSATVSGMITVSASATDNVAISSVELYVNNVSYNKKATSPYDFSLDTKTLPSGSNTLMAKAFDSSNNSNENTITVLVSNTSLQPSISITNPANGAQVTGRVTISAQTFGFSTAPAVKFYIDGSLKTIDTVSPYEYQWNTKDQSAGAHSITVEASDSNGNTASTSISVQITSSPGASKGKKTQGVELEGGLGMKGIPSEVVLTSFVETSEQNEERPILSSEVPIFDSILPQTLPEGDLLSISISSSDPEGDELTFPEEDQIIPTFSQLTDDGFGKATLNITPRFEDAGDYTMTITAKDNGEPSSSSSITILLTVTESTPDSVILYLQNQKLSLSSEGIKNLGEKVSYASQLHKYLVGATKQERSDFQDSFHGYINEAKKILQIGQGAKEKIIIQDISKAGMKLDMSLEKLNMQEEAEKKAKDAFWLIKKRNELDDTINQIVSVEQFESRGEQKDKKIEELIAKKFVLMKEVMIEEARQSNEDLTEDDVKKIVEKIDQANQSPASGQDNGGTKTNNSQGNGNDNSNKGNSGDRGNNSSKANSNDKGNKGGNDKSNK